MGLLCIAIGVQAQKKEKKHGLYIRMNVVDYLTREAVDASPTFFRIFSRPLSNR